MVHPGRMVHPEQCGTEATLLREQMITMLQTSIVFLLLTNAATLFAAVYALRRIGAPVRQPKSAIERNLDAMLLRRGH